MTIYSFSHTQIFQLEQGFGNNQSFFYVSQYFSTQPHYLHNSFLQLLKSSSKAPIQLQEGGYFDPLVGYELSWQT
jgi:hypothetical protein